MFSLIVFNLLHLRKLRLSHAQSSLKQRLTGSVEDMLWLTIMVDHRHVCKGKA